jgi:hypothetical protein
MPYNLIMSNTEKQTWDEPTVPDLNQILVEFEELQMKPERWGVSDRRIVEIAVSDDLHTTSEIPAIAGF